VNSFTLFWNEIRGDFARDRHAYFVSPCRDMVYPGTYDQRSRSIGETRKGVKNLYFHAVNNSTRNVMQHNPHYMLFRLPSNLNYCRVRWVERLLIEQIVCASFGVGRPQISLSDRRTRRMHRSIHRAYRICLIAAGVVNIAEDMRYQRGLIKKLRLTNYMLVRVQSSSDEWVINLILNTINFYFRTSAFVSICSETL